MVAPRIREMINSIAWQLNLLLILINYTKGLRVELTLALLSYFLKNVTFAIFGREPNGVRSVTRPHLYLYNAAMIP